MGNAYTALAEYGYSTEELLNYELYETKVDEISTGLKDAISEGLTEGEQKKQRNQCSKIAFPKPTIVQDMIRIWKEEFPLRPTELMKQVSKHLVAAFKVKFNSSLKEWRRYLRIIKTSPYVMKETFKLFIDWAIRFINIDKLKSGWLGTKEVNLPIDENEAFIKEGNHILSVKESEKM